VKNRFRKVIALILIKSFEKIKIVKNVTVKGKL